MEAEVLEIPADPAQAAPENSYGTAVRPKPKRNYVWLWVLFGLTVIVVCSFAVAATVLNVRLERSENGWSLRLPERNSSDGSGVVRDLPVSGSAGGTQTFRPDPGNSIQLHLSQGGPEARTDSAADLYQAVSPSVVCLEVPTYYGTFSLTGVVLSEDGYLLTAASELGGATEYNVIFSDGSTASARRVETDRVTGLTLLKAEANGLTPVTFSSDEGSVGQPVYLISNPFGSAVPNVLSEGMISAVQSQEVNGERYQLLLTSAERQSEGGGIPIFDDRGELVGLTTPIAQYFLSGRSDPCFALCSADLQRLVDELTVRSDSYDRIGLRVEEISAAMVSYYRFPGSLWITDISVNSSLYDSLAVNDVITAVNGVTVQTLSEYEAALDAASSTGTIRLTIYRSGVFYYVRIPVNNT